MSEKYTPRPDIQPSETNPFVGDLVDHASKGMIIKNKTRGRVMMANNGFVAQKLGLHNQSTGEVLEDESLVVAVKKAVDTEEFVKIFVGGMTALFGLSKRAYEVATCLMKSYNHGQLSGTNDLIYFNHREAVDQGYSRKYQTYKSALNELVGAGFMAPAAKGKDWYWINPTLFYRGDRVTIINQYVLNQECKTVTDPKLDQIDLFDGKTERERLSESQDQ